MPFAPGQSGNPAGRPRGCRNKVNRAGQALLDANAQTVIKEIMRRAMDGNPVAMRLCMERLVPSGRERLIAIELPPVEVRQDARKAVAEVSAALAEGEISIREANELLGVVDGMTRRALTSEALPSARAPANGGATDNINAESMAPAAGTPAGTANGGTTEGGDAAKTHEDSTAQADAPVFDASATPPPQAGTPA